MIRRFAAAAVFALLAGPALAQGIDLPPGALNDRDTQELKRRENRSDYEGALQILANVPGAGPKIEFCRKDAGTWPARVLECSIGAIRLDYSRRSFDTMLGASRR